MLQGGAGWGATRPVGGGVAATPLPHPQNCSYTLECDGAGV